MSRSHSSRGKLAAAVFLLSARLVRADAFFADQVIDYTPGDGTAGYQSPSAALGKPNPDTGFGVLTPFNSAFSGDHIVGVGAGGTLTVHLSKTAAVAGNSIGVHAGVGITDEDWPNGQAGTTATPYTFQRLANFQVSQDGVTWVDLGFTPFDIPTNFYATGVTTPGYQPSPGTSEADWGKSFAHPLSNFNNENWSQMLATLGGSAGGAWPETLVNSLAGINYVRFTAPAGQEHPMYVDSVVTNTDNVSITGSFTFHAAGQIPEAAGGTIITNTGTFTIDADVAVPGPAPIAASSFANLAIVRKTAGSGTATFTVPVYSDGGTFEVQSGTLALTSRFVTAAASVTTKSGPGTLSIAGPQYHGAGASFIASGGTTNFATDAPGLSINTSAVVNFATSQHLKNLQIAPTGVATVAASRTRTLYTTGLSIAAGGKLDLNDNDLVVSYGTSASPFTTVRALVFNGYSSTPDSTKSGIISTTGQGAGAGAGNTILALFDNSLIGAADWPLGSGQTIAASSVVGTYTFFGDMNLDKQVTPDDYGILDANFATTPDPGIAWLDGDANLDGSVTADDYAILDANFGSRFAGTVAAVSVPEPCLLGALALLAVRRGRHTRAS